MKKYLFLFFFALSIPMLYSQDQVQFFMGSEVELASNYNSMKSIEDIKRLIPFKREILNYEDRKIYSAGLDIGVMFFRALSLSTGLHYLKSTAYDFSLDNSIWRIAQPTFNHLNIPLNIRYRILPNKRLSPIVGTGIALSMNANRYQSLIFIVDDSISYNDRFFSYSAETGLGFKLSSKFDINVLAGINRRMQSVLSASDQGEVKLNFQLVYMI